MEKLNPPLIKGTLPAFYGNRLEVPFEMNKSVSVQEVKSFSLKIKTIQSNQILNYTVKQDQVVWDQNNSKVIFDISSFISLNSLNPLNIGQFYKIQIAYIGFDDTIGYYSTAGVSKYTAEPSIQIVENQHGKIYTGEYRQTDIAEKVHSYTFSLYDSKDNLIETSGTMLHNNTLDTEAGFSFDTYTIQKELLDNEVYYLTYSIKTVNGLEKSVQKRGIVKTRSINSDLHEKAKLVCNLDEENGYVTISLENKEDISEKQLAIGSFYLLRSSSEDDFNTWDEVYSFVLYGKSIPKQIWKDMTVKQGVTYKYAIEQYNINQLRSNKIESNNITVNFEYAFLFDGKRQLKIKYNPKVSSFKETVLETKIDTIGSKYPFIFRNGNVSYKEFPISGLISFLMDENKLFFAQEENDNYYDTNLTFENIQKERDFKLEVLQWLNNGQPKLFRSPTEGNYLVRLMNISLSPEEALGRMLHSFNCNAYEIAELTSESLLAYNIIDVNKKSENQIRWLSVDLLEKNFSEDENENLLLFPATSLKIDGMTPGDKIIIYTNNSLEGKSVVIGASGSYNIGLNNGITINKLYLGGDLTKKHHGILTYSYNSNEFKGNFDLIKTMQTVQVPVVQFIGFKESENSDGVSNNLLDNLKSIKERIDSIKYIRFSLRDAEQSAVNLPSGDSLDKIRNALMDTNIYKIVPEYEQSYWYDGYNNKKLDKNNNYNSKIIINENKDQPIDLQVTKEYIIKHPKDITSIQIGAGVICEICYQKIIINYELEQKDKTLIDLNGELNGKLTTINNIIKPNPNEKISDIYVKLKDVEDDYKQKYAEYCQALELAVKDAERG